MQTQTLRVGSQSINVYQSAGGGPAALLIHGNSASGLSFRHQLEGPLGQKYRLVAMDLPGHGASAPAADPEVAYTLPGYARIVVDVVEQLGLSRAVFVGWSLGGHIVLEASPQLPEAAGFMIFGTPPLAFPPDMANAFLPHPAVAAGFKADLTEAEMDAYGAAFFKPGTADIADQFKTDLRRTDGRARAALGGSVRPDGYRDEVKIVAGLSRPLAVLHGEQEQLVNLAYLKSLTMPTLWHGAAQVIPDSGHAPHWEQPQQFNALLAAFLEDAGAK